MAQCVLDACAVLAFLNDEQGADKIEAILLDETTQALLHGVNFVEVYYTAARKLLPGEARVLLDEIRDLGIAIREDMDPAFCMIAGDMRALVLAEAKRDTRGSLADSFCAALAERVQCRVVTADQKDFDPLVRKGRCQLDVFR